MMLLLFLFLLLCTAIAKGEDRLILMNGSNPCEGYIGIYHDNKLGYIGDKHWSDKTEDVVCKSTQCGKGNGSTQEHAMWPRDPVWLNEVKCEGHERHLGECKHPGFGISQFDTGTLRKIQCSKKINISLDGYACAGAVKYSTDAGLTYSGYFCKDSGWDEDASNILCKSLKCGTAEEIPKKPWITLKQSEKMRADCSGIKDLTNLWQCANDTKRSPCPNPATVICSDHEILQLYGDTSNVCSGWLQRREGKAFSHFINNKRSKEWCERMHCGTYANSSLALDSKGEQGLQLNCTDNVRVVLMDNEKPSHCYGKVYIKRNDSLQPVCASGWTDTEAEVVCKELRCGNVLSNAKSPQGEEMDPPRDVIMHNVECSGKEESLWHCRAQRDKNLKCSSKAYVVCSESMEVKLKDTPGKCAGRLEIKYEGKWQRNRSPGNSDFLERPNPNVKKEAVGITCQGHAMIFLEGDYCSGKPGPEEKVWDKFYSCSPKETSLFDCGETQNPKDNATIANVKCSGEKTFNLSEGCWGYVNVCLNGKCGGVCANPWTEEDSRMLCTSQNCGEHVRKPITKTKPMEVKFKSLHFIDKTHNLTNCNLVRFDDNDTTCDDDPAYVVCSGSVKASFNTSRKKCSGGLKVYYENQTLPVCEEALKDKKTRNIICQELECGQAADEIKDGPKTAKGPAISQIKCSRDDKALTQCTMNTNDRPCTPAALQCSSWRKFALVGGPTACSGNLFVHSKDNKKSAVSTEGWTETEGNRLCRDLNCGNLISNETRKTDASWTTSFSCAGVKKLESIWDCEKTTLHLPSNNEKQIFIECQGDPKNCSNAIGFSVDKMPNKEKEYYHVHCDHHHFNIGQCNRVKGKCDKMLVSVFCAGNVKFNSTEKCGGQIQVVLATTLSCTKDNNDPIHCVQKNSCANKKPAEIYCNGYVAEIIIRGDHSTPIVGIILGSFVSDQFNVSCSFDAVRIFRKRMSTKEAEIEIESGDYDNVPDMSNQMEDLGAARFREDGSFHSRNDVSDAAEMQPLTLQTLTAAEGEHLLQDVPMDKVSGKFCSSLIPSVYTVFLTTDGVTVEEEDSQEDYDDIEAFPEFTQTEAEVHESPQESTAEEPLLVEGDDDYLVPGQDG
ncbi:Scavenger receptor cysteine-rich type 1 protein M160 [Dissostichus eleginoides]|uniref:Scavenger receptor cysteine-rich type 1 protein M160 n=1 Tax=Dissostichus eleginoides TaxID=100907 RepID=A0AAD9CBF7_DISEL|nr:Scavenger receptor cysteine-rich type 1 protein M160 [Dissostichus eleginoides]